MPLDLVDHQLGPRGVQLRQDQPFPVQHLHFVHNNGIENTWRVFNELIRRLRHLLVDLLLVGGVVVRHLRLGRALLRLGEHLLLVLQFLEGQVVLADHLGVVHELVQLDGRLGVEVALVTRLRKVRRRDGLHLRVDARVHRGTSHLRSFTEILVQFLALGRAVLHEEVGQLGEDLHGERVAAGFVEEPGERLAEVWAGKQSFEKPHVLRLHQLDQFEEQRDLLQVAMFEVVRFNRATHESLVLLELQLVVSEADLAQDVEVRFYRRRLVYLLHPFFLNRGRETPRHPRVI